jgi:ATP synthase protein I
MTTESKQVHATGVGTLLGAASWALPAGLAVAAVGLAVDGSRAAYAGLAGALATVLVLAGGALAVDLVARVMPSASLLLGLLTYACQLLTVTLALATVADAAGRAATQWAAGSLIAVTLAWTAAHVLLATRRRIAAFDVALPGQDRSQDPSAPDAVSDAVRADAR